MEALVVLEEHEYFHEASSRAKELAREGHEQTTVRRSHSGWHVLVPPHMLAKGELSAADYVDDVDNYDPYDEEYHREVVQPLMEEFYGDQVALARSEEEGWFYED